MLNSSLLQRLVEKIVPTSPELFSTPSDNNITAFGVFAPELLDRIIDHLHNDRPTLLCLGRASRQTLIRSRVHLFSNLEFNKDGDRQFDTFLVLLEAPWTSFTNAVESIQIKQLFLPRGYKHLPNKNMPRILANLPNLKALRLTSISWPYIPPHIRDLLFQTDIVDLQLDSVEFSRYRPGPIDISELFVALQPSITSMTLYNLDFDDENFPDLSQHSSIFRRHIHLTVLDTCSLLLFKDVWDPLGANQLDITVESFHIRLIPMTRRGREEYTPFFSRFLRHVGPTLQHIFIKLSDPYPDMHALPYYNAIDLSQCVNVRVVHIGTITLDRISRSGEDTVPMVSTMWNSLSTLSSHSPSLEEVLLLFRPVGETLEVNETELESFAWLDLVGKLHQLFSNLRRITVAVGYFVVDEDFVPYLAALRRVPGIRQLEENGTVLLRMIPWESYGSPDPAWK
ncbi:hypothetical protein GALMADRAFT_1138844 [Galerina marginata CBS 339.88]|uniref:F-box domain-containing protein n=1 Tax=Galerina marginata (strain CBS 339.88) TaxID=685588 RepID=A0A067S784_GALM3|nr:hypothetical protein GALMADRAFT_1138844 [Galerina marginata CBS 339.88]